MADQPSRIKAIETRYAGCRFRSRLEARWAVFFDTLGIRWEYEPEGFLVGFDQRPYLPDFRLPGLNVWVEVKGDRNLFDWQLMLDAVDWGHGLPGMENTLGDHGGLLLLSDIPREPQWFPILQHQKGVSVCAAQFAAGEIFVGPDGLGYGESTWGNVESHFVESVQMIFDASRTTVWKGHDWVPGHYGLRTQTEWFIHDPRGRVLGALESARSARFEYGETPTPNPDNLVAQRFAADREMMPHIFGCNCMAWQQCDHCAV